MPLPNRVPLRVVGAPLRRDTPTQVAVAGEDHPRGIEYLEVEWFADKLTVEDLLACKTDEELRAFREKARAYTVLVALKAAATERK